jgi:molybdopterin-guanine dinucleotide biosynthesis protein A
MADSLLAADRNVAARPHHGAVDDLEAWVEDPGDAAAERRLLEARRPVPPMKTVEWMALMGAAAELITRHDLDAAQAMHESAWRAAYDRETQAATLHHVGRRWWLYNDRDAAAGCFELARALRRGFSAPELVASSDLALARTRASLKYDAVILSGGAGSRFHGLSKPERPLAGWPLLDHVLVATSGATTRVVVGPERRGLAEPRFCREEPAGGGPVAGIAAGIAHITQPVVAVLAGDLPFIGTGLDNLRSALLVERNDVAAFVDTRGRINYLAAVWRLPALEAAIARLGDPAGKPVRALFDGVTAAFIPDFDDESADVDTPNDLAAAQQRIRQIPPERWSPEGGAHRRARLPLAPLAWPGLELHAPS